MRILVIEDDELIAKPLAQTLSEQYYAVDTAFDGEAGWELAEAYSYDLVVLDVMLPKLDGISLCRRMRSHGITTPIILITAYDNNTNKVAGLDAGADDYIRKPFDFQELLARIRALLRRGNSTLPPMLAWENLRLDPSICEVTYNSKPVHLTPKEYSLLELFLRNSHRIFNCGAIIEHLWSFEEPPGEDTVRTHLKGLRMKLKKAGMSSDPIETVYGMGYRLREARDDKERQHSGSSPSNPPPQDIKQQTQRITAIAWERSKDKLSDRVTVIEQATTALLQDTLEKELLLKAHSEAHKLAGSLGMFGFEFGSRLAQQIEEVLEVGEQLVPAQKLHLSELVVSLRRELLLATTSQNLELSSVDKLPFLLVVNVENLLAEELVRLAQSQGMHSLIAKNPALVTNHLANHRPDIVVLDLDSNDTDDGLKLLAELNCSTPSVPVLVLTNQDSLLDRVKIARLGGQGFLQKPVVAAQVLEAIANLLQRNRQSMAKVLVVDDDSLILGAMTSLLEPWGLKVSTLDNPLEFWNTLEATAPHLLILDVEMPHMNGIELCQIVRNDPRYCGLPVLFLTAHTDADTMRRVFAVGADDYVSKPIVGPELVTRILNRLERSRWLRNMAQTDTLTGVANRRQSFQEFNELIDLSNRHHQPFCFIVFKINHLQQINQQYTHAVGDEVLSRLGGLLQRTFPSDIVCRWGGAEFVIGMYGMTHKDGWHRVEEVAENVSHEKFVAPNGHQFQVSFNVGIAQYPQHGTDLQTLYQAASARCDRVISQRSRNPNTPHYHSQV
ncbi:MAG: response regulator [Scytonema sp. PMC 1069.18]|nr:response regulator [Scytonema sp. PMC 1069.18]MEC4883989.1 response regulator [Scytonema sp. PMC 1070.18]